MTTVLLRAPGTAGGLTATAAGPARVAKVGRQERVVPGVESRAPGSGRLPQADRGHGQLRVVVPWRELAWRLRQRDAAALEEVYNLLAGRAFGLAYRVLSDGPAAEDIVQEAFLWFWDNPDRIDPDRGSIQSFLLTVVHRRAVDALRRRMRKEALTADPADEQLESRVADIAEDVLRSIDAEAVTGALDRINPDQRKVLEMAYFGGQTHSEISSELSIPVGTVKSRLRLGLAALRHAFGLEESR